MSSFPIALGLSLLGSVFSVVIASSLLLFDDRLRVRLIPTLISFAVGTLLGAALLGLLPEALTHLPADAVLKMLLFGIMVFFVLEKFVLWRHCHDVEGCEVHSSTATLVLIGDTFHNFIDGAIIGAAVLTSVPLGISTALAVAAHEIPQEIGDFAILLGAGYSRRRALKLNLFSGLAGVAGASAMFLMVDRLPRVLPYVLPFAAGSLLYVAMSDLIPNLHRGNIREGAVRQILLVSLGVLTILTL